jgi:hypothetical protein
VDPSYANKIKYKDSLFSEQGVRRWTIGETFSEDENITFINLKGERLKDYSVLKE